MRAHAKENKRLRGILWCSLTLGLWRPQELTQVEDFQECIATAHSWATGHGLDGWHRVSSPTTTNDSHPHHRRRLPRARRRKLELKRFIFLRRSVWASSVSEVRPLPVAAACCCLLLYYWRILQFFLRCFRCVSSTSCATVGGGRWLVAWSWIWLSSCEETGGGDRWRICPATSAGVAWIPCR